MVEEYSKDELIERLTEELKNNDKSAYEFRDNIKPVYSTGRGLTRKTVEEISEIKKEPDWMRRARLKALEIFLSKPMPTWGPDLSGIDFDNITYYTRPDEIKARSWDEVPDQIKQTFQKLGIPEMEQKYLAGSVAQYDSEGVYSNLRREWEEKGVIFTDLDTAVQKYPDLVKEYYCRAIPPSDNKFAALNGAVWSGGSFLYVPKGVKIDMPLQTYFRLNGEQSGQFEHTIVIADEGAKVHYIEGCTAPKYETNSLHTAIVEIYAHKNSEVKYTSVQNWSDSVYNLPVKRAWVDENAKMEWITGELGSKVTMIYPSSYLRGKNASTSNLQITLATHNTVKDAGGKALHLAPNTTSKIVSKSISLDDGLTVYRGLVRINDGARNSKSFVQCDALLINDESKNYTYPYDEIYDPTAVFSHEATVGRIGTDELTYLRSRGLSEDEASSMIVLGFMDDVMKEIPMEFAVEMNRLVKLEMSKMGAVG
ncbi:Fe-S cluster assembly protein SufB [Picrophilus oshimae]|uniref:ABC transporter ATP-binding protein n=1 Tax=Picrophilus torridus (strain ATCC 700027 / DSM 9790 / JCM 10055 / NBRC 100828 / KAW 2/3) TaxID=1122961 RepID=Q6L005_PICTO|nr:Fe-S cluster assembly protein SufB [Picrophilus oshimae]AAT43697.1 ABC transporter ATP-binding protein [Picrophilus oshimae DSM 9789]SMD31321.1 Iron-regulated ABC transporter membrane component SufB [Picrophilus oshimae DSM 9789]